MTIQNEYGSIIITKDAVAEIAGGSATNCFGVKGMTSRSIAQGFGKLLRRADMSHGVKVTETELGEFDIELHIAIEHGVNISAVTESIVNEVRYQVEELTKIPVRNVQIFVDAINVD